MIKHWRLFDAINTTQINQLRAANIAVKISDPESETLYNIMGHSVQKVVHSPDVFISTTSGKQETMLNLMFTGKLVMIAQEDGYDGHRYYQ